MKKSLENNIAITTTKEEFYQELKKIEFKEKESHLLEHLLEEYVELIEDYNQSIKSKQEIEQKLCNNLSWLDHQIYLKQYHGGHCFQKEFYNDCPTCELDVDIRKEYIRFDEFNKFQWRPFIGIFRNIFKK